MGELHLLRQMLRIAVRDTTEGSPRAAALLDWCRMRTEQLCLPSLDGEAVQVVKKRILRRRPVPAVADVVPSPWQRLRAALEEPVVGPALPPAPVLRVAVRVAALLGLAPADARLVAIAVACSRLRHFGALHYCLRCHDLAPGAIMTEMAGLATPDMVRRSMAVRLGLLAVSASRNGEIDLDPTDAMDRTLNLGEADDELLIESLVGAAVSTPLALDDFAEQSEAIDLMRRILAGALASGTAGVNMLLYGPPGTGKTELAKALAQAAGGRLYAIGEDNEYGEEPTRWDRVQALKLAQRVLANRRDAVLLFDEMEDLIGEAQQASAGGHVSRLEGSKVFVNRLFETNAVPILWTSNAIGNVDPAFLRRMTYVLKLDVPSTAARRRIVGRIAETEGVTLSEAAVDRVIDLAPEAVTVARNAIRAARLAAGTDTETTAVAAALVTGVRHGHRPPPKVTARPLDLTLYEADQPIDDLVRRIARPGAPLDVSLLLMGPPGTGKTALAHHLASALNRPLVVKRASDILSKWMGETEQKIAETFARAAAEGHVLLLDEIDSLLFDRADAVRSWEVTQVNELLTWMDSHPMPFVAATNHNERLDPAALRRFVYKLELRALSPDKAARAFARYFGRPAPAALADVGGLTPGDFDVVARQLRFEERELTPPELVRRLRAEASAKPDRMDRIGF